MFIDWVYLTAVRFSPTMASHQIRMGFFYRLLYWNLSVADWYLTSGFLCWKTSNVGEMKDEKSTARSLQSADTERRNAADVEDGQAGSGAPLIPTARAGTGIRVLKVPDPAPLGLSVAVKQQGQSTCESVNCISNYLYNTSTRRRVSKPSELPS